MRNFDRLTEDQIIDALSGGGIAVRKKDNKVLTCNGLNCNECRFCNGEGDCDRYQRHWLLTESVLPEAEHNYLSAVIKPFHNRVNYITKVSVPKKEIYFIQISLETDIVVLPDFPMDSDMYTDMEADYDYTLEELGLSTKVEE